MSWLDGFTDNSWLRLVRHNSTTGLFSANGSTISPTFSVATWADLAALNPTTYDGIVVSCTGVGLGGSLWKASAAKTRWMLAGPCYLANYALVADQVAVAAPKTSLTKFHSVTLPKATNWAAASYSIMRDGDFLRVTSLCEYVSAGGSHSTTLTRDYRFGTLNTTSDTLIEQAGAYSVSNLILAEKMEFVRLSSTSLIKVGDITTDPYKGASTSAAETATTVTNIDSADMYFSIAGKMDVDGTDTYTNTRFVVELVTPGN